MLLLSLVIVRFYLPRIKQVSITMHWISSLEHKSVIKNILIMPIGVKIVTAHVTFTLACNENCKILINMSNLLSLINETFHLVFSSRTSPNNFQTYVGISRLQIEMREIYLRKACKTLKKNLFLNFCVMREKKLWALN